MRLSKEFGNFMSKSNTEINICFLILLVTFQIHPKRTRPLVWPRVHRPACPELLTCLFRLRLCTCEPGILL